MMATSVKLAPIQSEPVLLRAEDLLTPEQLAKRLQVKTSWVFEQTRKRAKVRNSRPLPAIRLGKYLRFSWPEICAWLADNNC